MENLYLIPTDKPSRLWVSKATKDFNFGNPDINSGICKFKNIYITSDEKPKKGDYKICLNDNSITKYLSKKSIESDTTCKDCKKIILAEDPDLIKDGVQAIDDEFLEWFVKNPSCERVDINRDWGYPKIIIPKEEKILCKYCLSTTTCCDDIEAETCENIPQEEPKQETLEKAERKYSDKDMITFGWLCREKSLTRVELLINKYKKQ